MTTRVGDSQNRAKQDPNREVEGFLFPTGRHVAQQKWATSRFTYQFEARVTGRGRRLQTGLLSRVAGWGTIWASGSQIATDGLGQGFQSRVTGVEGYVG